jgi:hypothetical protein
LITCRRSRHGPDRGQQPLDPRLGDIGHLTATHHRESMITDHSDHLTPSL